MVTFCVPLPLRAAITHRSLLVAPCRLITSVVASLLCSVRVIPAFTSAGASGLPALIS